jgi:5-formyltetrahydrofolate cyclo-ligase
MAGVFVPGLGFDQRGYRLGRGKGFYDRYFQTEGAEIPYKVGICPEECLLESVDGTWVDSWDQKLQWVITEKRIIDCRIK